MELLILYIETALITAFIYLLLDHIWFRLMAKKIYFRHLALMNDTKKGGITYKKGPIITSRVIIAFTITAAVFLAILTEGKIAWSVSAGGLAGFALTSSHNLTAQSFIRYWPGFITVLDISWGTLQGMLAGIYIFIITGLLAA
ncbi:MAG TPA: DUF2177 family protein [Spirochaetota bacterium]|nr:DUF2177 family protein [Spirochaetota bacterium]HPJ34333.1 DUF2177 family protein [Spirochaetota bacterium]